MFLVLYPLGQFGYGWDHVLPGDGLQDPRGAVQGGQAAGYGGYVQGGQEEHA